MAEKKSLPARLIRLALGSPTKVNPKAKKALRKMAKKQGVSKAAVKAALKKRPPAKKPAEKTPVEKAPVAVEAVAASAAAAPLVKRLLTVENAKKAKAMADKAGRFRLTGERKPGKVLKMLASRKTR